MEKECEDDAMHGVRFRKGKGFAHQSTLAQGAVEAFDVVGAGFFSLLQW